MCVGNIKNQHVALNGQVVDSINSILQFIVKFFCVIASPIKSTYI